MNTIPRSATEIFGDEIVRPLALQRAVEHEREHAEREHRLGQDYRKREGRLVHGLLVLEKRCWRFCQRPAVFVAVIACSTPLSIASIDAELASITGWGWTP